MNAVERIHKAEDQVATMQSYLINAQEILGAAEEVAMVGRKARRWSRRLILLPITLLGIAAALIIWRKLKARDSESGATAEAPQPN